MVDETVITNKRSEAFLYAVSNKKLILMFDETVIIFFEKTNVLKNY